MKTLETRSIEAETRAERAEAAAKDAEFANKHSSSKFESADRELSSLKIQAENSEKTIETLRQRLKEKEDELRMAKDSLSSKVSS